MKSLKQRINESFENDSSRVNKKDIEKKIADKLGIDDVRIINKDHIAIYSTDEKIKKEFEKFMPFKYLQTYDGDRMIFKHVNSK